MKYLGKLAVAAIVVASASAANAQSDPVKIVAISHMQTASDFGNVVRNGAEAAAKELGVDLQYFANEIYDVVWMGQTVAAAVGTEPDAIAVSLPDADALGPSIKLAVDAGIPVITFNSGIGISKELGALLHVGQAETEAGFGAGVRLREAGGTQGLCINHEVGNVALDERCQGFAEGFEGPITVLTTGIDPTEFRNAVAAHLQQNPETDSVIILWAALADPLVAAVESVDRQGTVKLGTFDLNENALNYVLDGTVEFAIDQQGFLQGYMPIVMLNNYVRYGILPSNDVLRTGPSFVTKDNAAQVIDLSKQGIR